MTTKDTPYLNLAVETAKKAGHFLLKNIGKNYDIVAEEEGKSTFNSTLRQKRLS